MTAGFVCRRLADRGVRITAAGSSTRSKPASAGSGRVTAVGRKGDRLENLTVDGGWVLAVSFSIGKTALSNRRPPTVDKAHRTKFLLDKGRRRQYSLLQPPAVGLIRLENRQRSNKANRRNGRRLPASG